MLIDPDGRGEGLPDGYKEDYETGKLTRVDDTGGKDHDVIYSNNTDGTVNKDVSKAQTVEKGVLEKMYSQSAYDSRDKKWHNYDILKSRGDEKSKQLFEFLSKNSKVEWSRSMVGDEGDQGLNYITTSHEKGIDYGGGDLYNTQLLTYTYRGNDHSHDNNTTTVSPGDVGFATTVQKLHPNAKFNIFTPINGKYTPFDQFSAPGNLPIFEIIAPKIKK